MTFFLHAPPPRGGEHPNLHAARRLLILIFKARFLIIRHFFQVVRQKGNEERAVKEAWMERGALPQGRARGALPAAPAARRGKAPCALWHRRGGGPRAVRFVAPRQGGSDGRAGGGPFRRARGLPAPCPAAASASPTRRSLPLGASILVLGSLHPGFSSARTQNRK